MNNKKRAIIIGSGLGGLSLGILLAKKGFKVKIFEKNQNFGGRVNFFKESGHIFDMGPSWLLMLDIFEDFYKLIGEDISKELNLIKLDPSFKIYFDDKKSITVYNNLEKNKNNFENLESGSYDKIKNYIDLQEEIYSIIKKNFLFNEINIKNLINFELLREFFKFNPFLSADKYLRKILKNEKLLKILEFDFLFLGTDPKIAPSVYGIINYFLFKQGIFYPKGGIYKIVESFLKIGQKLGIEYYNNLEVLEILIKNNKAFGIKLINNKIFEADYIISNADLYHTEINLIKNKKYRTYDKDYWDKIKIAPSGFILYLGLNQKIKDFEHHNFYFSKDWDLNFKQIFNYNNLPDDPSFYICMPSKNDNLISPQNKDQLFILVPISGGNYLNSQDKECFKNKIYEIIEQKMNIKDFKKMIEFERIYSIDDFKKDYNALEGTALGIIHNLKQTLFRPKNKSKKIKNLYYVGSYVNPGIGMPMVVASAIITYKKILNDIKKI